MNRMKDILVERFIFSSGGIVVTLVILWHFIKHHHQVNILISPVLWFRNQELKNWLTMVLGIDIGYLLIKMLLINTFFYS